MAIFLGFNKFNERDSLDNDNYLSKSGRTMSGDINLNKNDITNILDTPPTDSSTVSKKYVKDNYVNNSGGTGMVGNLGMNRNIIFNLANELILRISSK